MRSNETAVNVLLDELLNVFYHKFIYYLPSEIIIDGVLEQLKDDIDDDFFDEFYFIDNYLGNSKFYNEDALELNTLLSEKRSFLQQNTFKLVEKRGELSEFEFLVIIEKYYEKLSLFIYISEWLSINIKKYNGEDIHISIIGAFKIQQQYFLSHLKDVCNYFGEFLDLEMEFDFSKQSFITRYLSELSSRYVKIVSDLEEKVANKKLEKKEDEINTSNQKPIKEQSEIINTKKKRQRPVIDEKKIEKMILEKVFKIIN